MKAKEIAERLGFTVVQSAGTEQEILTGYTSDLLSDVMANADEGSLLITIQGHKNTIAVASLSGCPAIVICNDRPIPEEMIQAAEQEEIALFSTGKNQYMVSGELYALLG
ncbi:MAG: iron-sulfur binding hydrogenase [Spirochaetaceae bacterium]